ncbi:MAG: hypothetical protein SynsKO_20880 [Synoicihabitans sp.]
MLVAMIRWPRNSWSQGARNQLTLPIDLTEAYQRCFDLAFTYGDLIDTWEINNEPDIGFVPENAETFAAFYKACALGIIAGREAAEQHESGEVKGKKSQSEDGDRLTVAGGTWPVSHDRAESAVMHSPLALPPGPYWEELAANDVLSYTEVFNYHYYGYAEDFGGVRDAWLRALNRALRVGKLESAAGKVSRAEGSDLHTLVLSEPPSPPGQSPLPLFLTEFGYGLLDRFDRHTTEGRQRQANWFKEVLPSLTDGTITGAMAFVFMPWMSQVSVGNEFGLLAEVPKELQSVLQAQQSEKVSAEPARYEGKEPKSNLRRFTSDDLNPVVIDFFAGDHTQSVKRYNGHLLQQTLSAAEVDDEARKRGGGATNLSRPGGVTRSGALGADEEQMYISASSGEFTLVLYNFSDEPVSGRLSISLENGHVWALLDNARPEPALEPDSSENAPGPSTSRTSAQAVVNKPQPYFRPPVPSSSLRPITKPDWPNAETPTVTTEDGKTYAVTPALEFLQNAAQKLVEGRVTNVESHNWQQNDSSESTEADTAYAGATKKDRAAGEHDETGLSETGYSERTAGALADQNLDLQTLRHSDLKTGFVSNPLTLAPMERRELRFIATLPNESFSPHRLSAVWKTSEIKFQPVASALSSKTPEDEERVESAPTLPANAYTLAGERPLSNLPNVAKGLSLLATQLYPSPSAFRLQTIDRFNFNAADNAEAQARQLSRRRATGEAVVAQHPTAKRWLSTPGVNIEETTFGWRITVNDLPPEPLRPAEIELPMPDDWHFPTDSALSFQYRLIIPESNANQSAGPPQLTSAASEGEQDSTFRHSDSGPSDLDAMHPDPFEEFDVNFRDANGTLWSVWPRLFAKRQPQSYLELLTNFTPMFFSRAKPETRESIRSGLDEQGSLVEATAVRTDSLVLMLRPRTLPTTIELLRPQIAEFESEYSGNQLRSN